MFLRTIPDEKLAQTAYLIGCQKTGEAIVIDPQRDVDRYIAAAGRAGLRVTAAAETHIHADFLSGCRELAERTGARLYLSDEGDADWKYQWLNKKSGGGRYDCRLLCDGDTFSVGRIEFRVVHTPGHTPEHMCFLVIDRSGGAGEPMGMVTGDFVFVGDLGRPDLLETAAGQSGAKEPAARALFRSLSKLADLPDYLQVWPAHGAGSACGKALGAVPQSTIGYERRFNAAIRAAAGEPAFVNFILSGQPEPPLYFARMKRLNKEGPPVLGELPRPKELPPAELSALKPPGITVIDTREWDEFRAAHLPESLNIPLDAMFPTLAGSYVDPASDVCLIVECGRLEEAVRDLVRVGIDRVTSWTTPESLRQYAAAGRQLVATPQIDAPEARRRIESGQVEILDVRGAAEFAAGHLAGARNIAHTRLPAHLAELAKDRPLVVNCQSGRRSARACSLLERAGFDVANLAGGFLAWQQSGFAVWPASVR